MGMIAGAVGMVMYAHWWIGKHQMTREEFEKAMEETEEKTHE